MACVYIQEMTDLKSVIDYTVAFAGTKTGKLIKVCKKKLFKCNVRV